MKLTHYINTICVGLAALQCTSCDDFLDLTPLNEIVKENYWTEKADVESMVYACYSAMETNDVMLRMLIWGEMRSDNISENSKTPYNIQQIIKENILQTNEYMKWQSFYQVINRCNTVIKYAPEVAQKDPNYTDSELRATIAEVTALRALCYFYLVRTFRDVPYVTSPSDNDNDIEGAFRVAATPMNEVIDALIADLEAVKGDALRLYPDEGYPNYTSANTSRITTCAIYALLADLYLWKNDYAQCMHYSDLVTEYKRERYTEDKEDNPLYYKLYGKDETYPLIPEQPSGNSVGTAYNEIFGTGNSYESIFELYFASNQSQRNALVSGYYGTSNTPLGNVSASDFLSTGVYDETNTVFKPTDCRFPEYIKESGTSYAITKYAYDRCSFVMSKNKTKPAGTGTYRSSNYANWILYRYTDVLLMKAEAEVELAANAGVESDSLMQDAFDIVSAIYNRANNLENGATDALKYDDYKSTTQMRELVALERQRELMFEGKRWFDLVRGALRANDNTGLIETVVKKQKDNTSAIKIKLSKQDALFFPYAETELDANPKLKQNIAYITNETSSKQ